MGNNSQKSNIEFGGVTILVCLLLLVLLTVAALAMSKNSLREITISGTSRHAADVRNVADSGLEWSMFWMADNTTRPAATGAALALRDLTLSLAGDPTRQGVAQPLATTGEMAFGGTNPTRQFGLSLTTMGELEVGMSGKDSTKVLDAFNPATLQLWSVRSEATIAYASAQTFIHRREAWFTLLPK